MNEREIEKLIQKNGGKLSIEEMAEKFGATEDNTEKVQGILKDLVQALKPDATGKAEDVLEELVKVLKPNPAKHGKNADEKKIIKAVLKQIPHPTVDEIVEKVLAKIPKSELDEKGLTDRILAQVPKIELPPVDPNVSKIPYAFKEIENVKAGMKDVFKRLSFQSSNQTTSFGGEVDKLSQLTGDVKLTSPSNNQVLTFNSTLNKWINANSTGGVTSLNSLTGAITLAAGTNISLGTVGNTITINATGFVNPMTTTGDIIYSTNNSGSAGRLGIGSSGQVLTVSGGIPSWQNATGLVTSVSNSDGTLTISPTTGDVVASLALSHANTWTGLQTFTATSDSTKGLVVKGFSGTQSASLQEWQDNTGALLAKVSNVGDMVALSNFTTGTSIGAGIFGYNTYYAGGWKNLDASSAGIFLRADTSSMSVYTATSGATPSVGSIFSISTLGVVNSVPAGFNTFPIYVHSYAASDITLIVRGASSQTGDLTQWQDSSATVLSVVDKNGNFGIGTTSPSYKLHVMGTQGNDVTLGVVSEDGNSIPTVPRLLIQRQDANGNPNAYVSSTITNATLNIGTNALVVDSSGNVGVGTTSPAAAMEVATGGGVIEQMLSSHDTPGIPNSATMTIRRLDGNGSQLAKWGLRLDAGNSNNLELLYGTSGAYANTYLTVGTTGNVGIGTTAPGAQLQLNTSSTSTIGTIIQGFSSQTANLQEWQNSSGTVLASINAAGSAKVQGFTAAYIAKTANYTATANDFTIDCTSGTFTVSLPTAVGITGCVYVIKNSGAGVITIDANGSETIDGALTQTLSTQYSSIMIQSNNANWIII